MIKLPNGFFLWYTYRNISLVLKGRHLPIQYRIGKRIRFCQTLFLFSAYLFFFAKQVWPDPQSIQKCSKYQQTWQRRRDRRKSSVRHVSQYFGTCPYQLTSLRKEITAYNEGRTSSACQIFPTATGSIRVSQEVRSFSTQLMSGW